MVKATILSQTTSQLHRNTIRPRISILMVVIMDRTRMVQTRVILVVRETMLRCRHLKMCTTIINMRHQPVRHQPSTEWLNPDG